MDWCSHPKWYGFCCFRLALLYSGQGAAVRIQPKGVLLKHHWYKLTSGAFILPIARHWVREMVYAVG